MNQGLTESHDWRLPRAKGRFETAARLDLKNGVWLGTRFGPRELGYSRAQVYVLLNRFLADPRLTSLLPRKRGPVRGRSRLSSELDQLIERTFETAYLARQRPRLVDLVTEIR